MRITKSMKSTLTSSILAILEGYAETGISKSGNQFAANRAGLNRMFREHAKVTNGTFQKEEDRKKDEAIVLLEAIQTLERMEKEIENLLSPSISPSPIIISTVQEGGRNSPAFLALPPERQLEIISEHEAREKIRAEKRKRLNQEASQ